MVLLRLITDGPTDKSPGPFFGPADVGRRTPDPGPFFGTPDHSKSSLLGSGLL